MDTPDQALNQMRDAIVAQLEAFKLISATRLHELIGSTEGQEQSDLIYDRNTWLKNINEAIRALRS